MPHCCLSTHNGPHKCCHHRSCPCTSSGSAHLVFCSHLGVGNDGRKVFLFAKRTQRLAPGTQVYIRQKNHVVHRLVFEMMGMQPRYCNEAKRLPAIWIGSPGHPFSWCSEPINIHCNRKKHGKPTRGYHTTCTIHCTFSEGEGGSCAHRAKFRYIHCHRQCFSPIAAQIYHVFVLGHPCYGCLLQLRKYG